MNEKGLPTIHFVPTVNKIKVDLTDMYGMLQADLNASELPVSLSAPTVFLALKQ
jgi:hypothetical protein